MHFPSKELCLARGRGVYVHFPRLVVRGGGVSGHDDVYKAHSELFSVIDFDP